MTTDYNYILENPMTLVVILSILSAAIICTIVYCSELRRKLKELQSSLDSHTDLLRRDMVYTKGVCEVMPNALAQIRENAKDNYTEHSTRISNLFSKLTDLESKSFETMSNLKAIAKRVADSEIEITNRKRTKSSKRLNKFLG